MLSRKRSGISLSYAVRLFLVELVRLRRIPVGKPVGTGIGPGMIDWQIFQRCPFRYPRGTEHTRHHSNSMMLLENLPAVRNTGSTHTFCKIRGVVDHRRDPI